MHECPFCGEVCDCDIEDTWNEEAPTDCPHVCKDESDNDFDEFDSDEFEYGDGFTADQP